MPEDLGKIGSILGVLAGGNPDDLYGGDWKDSYLQQNDGQSIHALMGARYNGPEVAR